MITSSPSSGGIVMRDDGRMVLVEQNGNSWSFPKGHVEEGETLLGTARREIFEETGLSSLVISLVRELGSYERASLGKDGVTENTEGGLRRRTLFLFHTHETKIFPNDPCGEITEVRWVTFEEALLLLTHPKDRLFLLSVRDILKI